MKVLNCSTNTIITEETARINFQGTVDSVYNIYNNACIYDSKGNIAGYCFNNVEIPMHYARNFYYSLWWYFFRDNRDMIQEILRYDDYSDNVPEEINSPAAAFRIIKKYGITGLGSNCRDFLKWLRSRSDIKTDNFHIQKRKADRLVHEKYGSVPKDQIITEAQASGSEWMVKIVRLLLDKASGSITDALYIKMMDNIRRDMQAEEQI